MIELLITVMVFILILFVVFYLLSLFPIPANIRNAFIVIAALICLLLLLQRVGLLGAL